MAAKIIPKRTQEALRHASVILATVVAVATVAGFIARLAVWVHSVEQLKKENADLNKRLTELSNQITATVRQLEDSGNKPPEPSISAEKLVGNWCLKFGEAERARVRISSAASGENRIEFSGQELRGNRTLKIVGQGTVIGKTVSVYYSMMDGDKELWNGSATATVHSENLITGNFDNSKGKSGMIDLKRV